MYFMAKNKEDGILIESPMTLEDVFAPRTDKDILARRLVSIAMQQIQTSMKFKRDRMEQVQKSIDLYHGKTKKALKGRWNLPLPLMSGYIDTLLSKTDDAPKIKFGYQDLADLRRAAKVQAKWDQDSTSVEGRWAEKDRDMKFLASFYGVGIPKYFAYNDRKGEYNSHFEFVDPLDFECEPMGGQNIRNHKFKGQRNIFKTKTDLQAGGMSGIYDKRQVLHLISAVGSDDYKHFERTYEEKTDRMKSLGFDTDSNSYIGVPIFNLTEWYMEDPDSGVWYYLLFEARGGIWVRCEPLAELFESGEDPFDAWHTHRDPFNFWSKAPADDMRPVAEGMSIVFNQMLDAREKRVYAQRAYDTTVFPDPSQLEWRPDGLVEATTDGVRSISSGIYEFKIDGIDETGTINLMKFVDDVTGLKTGITPSAQGETEDKRVGIYFGNLQQVADRLGLYNKSYSECYGRVGRKYYFGLRQFVKSNRMMVRMVGLRGYNWEELTKEDTNPVRDFNIEIVGGQAQTQLDEILKKTKTDSLIAASPLGKINPEAFTEEILRNGGWEEGQIKRLMDLQSYGSEEMMSVAEQAVQDIVYNNKEPKLYRKATYFFMQYILDKADELYDHEDVELSEYQNLLAYAEAHMQYAVYNMNKQSRLQAAMMPPMEGEPEDVSGKVGAVSVPGSPSGSEGLGFTEQPLDRKTAIETGAP